MPAGEPVTVVEPPCTTPSISLVSPRVAVMRILLVLSRWSFGRVRLRRRRLAEAKHLRPFIVGATIDWLRWQLRLRRWRRALARLLGSAPEAHPPPPRA